MTRQGAGALRPQVDSSTEIRRIPFQVIAGPAQVGRGGALLRPGPFREAQGGFAERPTRFHPTGTHGAALP